MKDEMHTPCAHNPNGMKEENCLVIRQDFERLERCDGCTAPWLKEKDPHDDPFALRKDIALEHRPRSMIFNRGRIYARG